MNNHLSYKDKIILFRFKVNLDNIDIFCPIFDNIFSEYDMGDYSLVSNFIHKCFYLAIRLNNRFHLNINKFTNLYIYLFIYLFI